MVHKEAGTDTLLREGLEPGLPVEVPGGSGGSPKGPRKWDTDRDQEEEPSTGR